MNEEGVKKVQEKLVRHFGILQRKIARLERTKNAIGEYKAGRISWTELRRLVPRSWLPVGLPRSGAPTESV